MKLQLNKHIFYSFICYLSIMSGFSVAAYQRNLIWKESMVLWIDVLKKSPEKYRSHISYGSAHHREGNIAKAIEEYKTAIRLNPNYALGVST